MNWQNHSSPSWIVGLYHRNEQVCLAAYEDEDRAQAVYSQSVACSRVLLRKESATPETESSESPFRLIRCDSALWDTEGIGVAVLLLKSAGKTDEEIRQELQQGHLAFLPSRRTAAKQMLVKVATKLFFGRLAVVHFGSAPYRYKSLCFFDKPLIPCQKELVALTIDDAPCRFADRNCSELPRVRALLQKHQAKATFMLVGSWSTPHHRDDLVALLQEGHEIGNHCMMDRSYEFDEPHEFGRAVDECSNIIIDLQKAAGIDEKDLGVNWFRAPHGRYTKVMAKELSKRGLTNVMCDTYASCPIVQDADFVARHLTKNCRDGSILLLHMPEVHVRQWCFPALEALLEGLLERNFQVVTIGELAAQRRRKKATEE